MNNFKEMGKANPIFLPMLFLTLALMLSCNNDDNGSRNPELTPAQAEARLIVALGAQEAGRTVEDFSGSSRDIAFPDNYNVFLPSAISFSKLENPDSASVRIPIYEGIIESSGNLTYFIITESSTMETAQILGVNLSPKLRYGTLPAAAAAVQRVTLDDEGRIIFRGDVDFEPERRLVRGDAEDRSQPIFPPSVAEPGGLGDSEYSSLVVLPSGLVINAQIIYNSTGRHDRIINEIDINIEERWVDLQLLDGWAGGDRYYYHLVTDASDPIAATIELGVYAPRLHNLPVFGQSGLDGETMLLGFSPNVNGLTTAVDGATRENRQGLSSTIVDDDLDPVNVFPFDPDNSREEGNNYSPLWDAHLSEWTDDAINGSNEDQRRSITGFSDLEMLIEQGLVTSFSGSEGRENDFVYGLRASEIIINCPVICHPSFQEN